MRLVIDIEKERKYQREWKQKRRTDPVFREKELLKNAKWREGKKEQINNNKKDYYERNKEKLRKLHTERYHERKKREVSWDQELTSLVFREAKRLCKLREAVTGKPWSIDHRIPLKGKTISGLHVWNNLQVIPLSLNKRKHNKHEAASD
jgi:hypothetical protein